MCDLICLSGNKRSVSLNCVFIHDEKHTKLWVDDKKMPFDVGMIYLSFENIIKQQLPWLCILPAIKLHFRVRESEESC